MCSNALAEYGIVIDKFRLTKLPADTQFFLTHLHTDHMEGLNANWKGSYLNVSNETYRHMVMRYGEDSQVCNVTTKWTLYEWRQLETPTKILGVCIPSNHSPGSVMWVFKIYVKPSDPSIVVHTGDYRTSPELIQWFKTEEIQNIEVLFFDSSFHDPSILIPTLEQSMVSMDFIYNYAQKHGKRLAVITHTNGTEQLVGSWCKTRSIAWNIHPNAKNRNEILYEMINITTPDLRNDTGILCVNPQFRNETDPQNYVHVKPCAVWYQCHNDDLEHRDFNRPHVDETYTHRVFYSNHASFVENIQLQKLLNPKMCSRCIPLISPNATCKLASVAPHKKYDYSKFLPYNYGQSSVSQSRRMNK